MVCVNPESGVLGEAAQDGAPTRLALTLAYDGGPFSGWARQPGLPSVQEALEEALATITREHASVTVAGRTDAGVHARSQVVHVDLSPAAVAKSSVRDGAEDVTTSLVRRLNSVLRRATHGAVVVHSARRVPPGWDARFSAVDRSYSYWIADAPERWDPLRRGDTLLHPLALDVGVMQAEAAALIGLHDFLSFCKPRDGATTIRELQALTVGREPDGRIVVRLTADAFCHHMVRTIVGTLVQVGEGRRETGWAKERLDARVRDAATRMVPGHALVLEAVGYPADDAEAVARASLTRARRSAHELPTL